MSRLPGWFGRLGAGLTRVGDRLEERRERTAREASDDAPEDRATDGRGSHDGDSDHRDSDHRGTGERPRTSGAFLKSRARLASRRDGYGNDDYDYDDNDSDDDSDDNDDSGVQVPAPPAYAPAIAAKPEAAAAVPWGLRVAAEAGWRLLVLAGALWVLMQAISAIQLVVLAFVAALLITALLQPTVAWLKRLGLPRGLATAVTFIAGFVIMGLVGWFVVWQVMENIDTLSDRVQQGIDELQRWLLESPFHVTEDQIKDIAKNLREAVGTNTEEITTAGLEGVTVMVEILTGILLAMFSTLFLLYDGKRIWKWCLKLVPSQARPGVAGAGPRAWRTLTAYVRGTVIVALIDAIFIGLGIYFLDVPMAVPLAVFIFLFAFIPLVGAVVSGALAVVVALVTQGVFTALMALIVVLAVQQIEGHILQPFILGRAVRVHPLAVVLSVAAGGFVAGIGGAVVAVPLVAVTNTVVGYLRAYAAEQSLRNSAQPQGATAAGAAPARAVGADPEDSRDPA
ncbi:pheromone autoinducer 2 transporter [Streptomyces sp. YIM 130001]|uniref:AI-2E family transporter n=1 Tax=Streptomyces sp. YIM 130001 TaxID=2259644 RepID=UPI000ED55662|nr:AI-2E family transporter [Streptomyces sp. YIM 130001]RII20788.1 pheromone autoinducer 2 transporter [Streptomyces sp. YIM 130001]